MKKTAAPKLDSKFIRLTNIFIGHGLDLLGRSSQQKTSLPRTINSMHLVEDMSTKNGVPFGCGLYQAIDGKKYFIKMWSGSRKNADYYNLLHEASVLAALNSIQKRTKNKTPLGFVTIQIPNLVSIHIGKKDVRIIMEYYKPSKTRVSLDMSLNEKIEFASRFVQRLGENASLDEKHAITTKKGFLYTLQFPLICLKLFIKRPALIRSILFGILVFYKAYFAILRSKTNILVHGDLQENNIIYSKGKIIITDFEQTIFTFADIENITMASSSWIDEKSRNSIVGSYLKNKKSHSLWNALAIYSMFFSLTGNVSKDAMQAYKSIISIAINDSFSMSKLGKKNLLSFKINI